MIAEARVRPPGVPLTLSRGEREAVVLPISEFVVSPSLQSINGSPLPPAYEVKFVLTEEQAQRVEAELRPLLIPDPHGQSGGAGGYSTTTVYCDTPAFDVYHRQQGFARRKFRLRRYGLAETVFLERKAKQGTRVRKRRSSIAVGDLDRLGQPPGDLDWSGDWFHRRVSVRQLRPVLAVMYDRTAFVGAGNDGPLRLTFDRSIRGVPFTDWHVAPFAGGHGILSDRVVCEFKFRGAMPAAFKAAIAAQQLSPESASKYRRCLEAAGLVRSMGTPHA
jgi:hypothetical protein